MPSIKGTKTEKNVLAAFAGESQARNRYTYFASAARKEGYEQIAAIFEETANQEKEHAKRFFKFLEGGEVEIVAAYPAGIIADTAANLAHAAEGEKLEYTSLYPGFASVAEGEGLKDVATAFRMIVKAEERHHFRYIALMNNVKEKKVFQRPQPVRWTCRNCGYVHEGTTPPNQCPACLHHQAYFELEATNY
ncbi:MAG: rubrerythrin family protein [Sedimentisphaerales bacterium]|nr:rubrerythrin family protein [Sedimentisphaerales bacterium]